MKVVTSPKPNVISVLTSSVKSSAKLPLSRIRGSEGLRYKKAQEFSDILINRIDGVSKGGYCYVKDFKNIIKEILYPNKIDLSIKPQKIVSDSDFTITTGSLDIASEVNEYSTSLGATSTDYYESQIFGYQMNLPLDITQRVIKDKHVAIHEARHFFDCICNPKTLVERNLGINLIDSKRCAFNGAYECLVKGSCAPLTEYFLKLKAQRYLSQLSDEECINCLQYARNVIKTEINAYNDGLSCLKKDVDSNFSEIMTTKLFIFSRGYSRRLSIVNQMLSDKITEVRRKIHKNNSKAKAAR